MAMTAKALIAPTIAAANDDLQEETIEVRGMKFTRTQIEDGAIIDEHCDRIADAIAEDIYFERYQPENRVRDLNETADVVEALFDRLSDDPRGDALRKLGESGNCTHWLYHEEIVPAVEKVREEIHRKAEDLGWELNLGGEDNEFDWEIADLIRDKLEEDDKSKPTDMLSSCDRAEIAFVLMPRAKNIYPDDYCVASHKSWADWEHLGMDQGWLETLPRLGYTLGEYRRHSGNKHKREYPLSRYPRRRPVATLDEIRELVENACSNYFHFAIYAQVPLSQLLNIDLERPVVLSEYSLCTYSDSGTFHSVEYKQPIVLNPEDGIWKPFGKSGPSKWCGMVNSYYHANIRN